MHNIIFLGPQGAGKGTQVERLALKLGVPVISLGKLFRAEVDRGTGLGREISQYTERGDRVPAELVNQIMRMRLMEEDTAGGMILEGYPRTKDQVESFEEMMAELGRSITHAIFLNIPDDDAVRRLSGRRVCSNPKCGRSYHVELNPPKVDLEKCDLCGSPLAQMQYDSPEAIGHRLELYHKDTEPLIAYYKNKGVLHEIDGLQTIDKVDADIAALFK